MKNCGLFLNMVKGCFCLFRFSGFNVIVFFCLVKLQECWDACFPQLGGLCGVASSCLFGFGSSGCFCVSCFCFSFWCWFCFCLVALFCFMVGCCCFCFCFCIFFLLVFFFVFCFLGGGPPHLALDPPYFFVFVVLFVCFFVFVFLRV